MEEILRRLERRYGHLAVPNIWIFLVAPKLLLIARELMDPGNLGTLMVKSALIPYVVIHDGEWMRILTFVCVPPTVSPIWFLLYAYLTYLFCSGLEQKWGAFRTNVYILFAWLCAAVTPFLIYPLNNAVVLPSFTVGEQTIFLAFAVLYPNFTLNLFFILPVKVKYLAILAWLAIGFAFFNATGWGERVVLVALVLNYLAFFGPAHVRFVTTSLSNRRRRRKWQEAMRRDDEP